MPPFTARSQARPDTSRKAGTAVAWTVIVSSMLLALPLYAATWILVWIPFGAIIPPFVAGVLTIGAMIAVGMTSRSRGSGVALLSLIAAVGVWVVVLLPYWQFSNATT